jgi:hypothetical protein
MEKPEGHASHDVPPAAGWISFLPQMWHASIVFLAALESVLARPAGHSVHAPLPSVSEYVPNRQSLQTESDTAAASEENLPLGHLPSHRSLPVSDENQPDGHSAHDAAPLAGAYCPRPHAKQEKLTLLLFSWYRPGEHLAHFWVVVIKPYPSVQDLHE